MFANNQFSDYKTVILLVFFQGMGRNLKYLFLLLCSIFMLCACEEKIQVTVENMMTHTTIGAVYLMTDSIETGPNLLTYSLTPGLSETIDMPSGTFLFKIIDSEAREYSMDNFIPQDGDCIFITPQMCDSFPTTVEIYKGMYAAGHGDSIIYIENNLAFEDILFLKTRTTGFGNSWGKDLLGVHILHPGESIMLKSDTAIIDILAEGDNIYLREYFSPVNDTNWIISEKYQNKMTYSCGSGNSELVIINGIPDFTGVYVTITQSDGSVETVDFENGFFRTNDQILVRLEPGIYDIFIEGTGGDVVIDDIQVSASGDTLLIKRNMLNNGVRN